MLVSAKKILGFVSKFTSRLHPATFFDVLIWCISIPISIFLRFDGNWPKLSGVSITSVILIASFLNFILSLYFKINSQRYIFGSIDQIVMIWIAVTFVSIALFAMTTLIGFPEIPRSVILIASTVSFLIQSSLRVIYRMNWISRNDPTDTSSKVLIYGAGVAGRQLAEQLLKMKDKYKLIGFLDDNKIKINSRVFGEKVFGTIDEIETICVNNRPELIIVAVSDLNLDKLQFLREFTKARDIELRIIPAAQKIISGEVSLQDTFSIDDINILNRQELQTFSKQVEDFYSTKRVLVTGAGGSIGSELVKQVKQTGCSEIYLLDRDENRLLETLIQIDNQSSLADDKVYLADIRDGKNLLEIIAQIKPDVIFHAAALKHVSALERFPDEALRTNFEGTRNIWKAALEAGVPFLVNISSDKAADPTTKLGESKLLAERLIAGTEEGDRRERRYLSVRFGNVIGSNGSFVHIFKKQIEDGGPVTVRHPDLTRYFMTTREAVKLVMEALLVGKNGETLVLDMGAPVSILEVAKRMIRSSGRSIQIEISNLNPGEKVHEQLLGRSEEVVVRGNPRIFHTKVKPLEEFLHG